MSGQIQKLQAPPGLIKSPIKAKTSQFYVICSLHIHTVQAYTTEQDGKLDSVLQSFTGTKAWHDTFHH